MTVKILLIGAIIIGLSGCEIGTVDNDILNIKASEIPSHYRGADLSEINQDIDKLKIRANTLNHKVEVIDRYVLKSSEQPEVKSKTGVCNVDRFFRPIYIPKRIDIKDDGSLSDTELIERLVKEINSLKGIMHKYNSGYWSSLKKYNQTCLSGTSPRPS